MYYAADVFIIFSIFVLIGTVQGIILFYNRQVGFEGIFDAIVTTIVFMVSAENYPDVVWRYEFNPIHTSKLPSKLL